MKLTFSKSPQSIRIRGKRILGAEDRHRGIPGWDQEKYSKAHVLCIGAGGLISNIAPTLCRKGIGKLTILDDDTVEVSNLNRQRFYEKDVGREKAIALVENLQRECIFSTELIGHAVRLEEAIKRSLSLDCDVAVCGADNNPARTAACQFFQVRGIPVIFTAVSADADHGYVFVQHATGSCLGCLFPDLWDDSRFPCPATPAITDILQATGALVVYAVDTLLLNRPRAWNHRRVRLSSGMNDASCILPINSICVIHGRLDETTERRGISPNESA
ncbi:MAG TPA: ThiF family adenylyltransferase [Bryobacteraceae bacterium]|nr:ThiF family adenylyltransferase [Bryobacteraceae bacterium]